MDYRRLRDTILRRDAYHQALVPYPTPRPWILNRQIDPVVQCPNCRTYLADEIELERHACNPGEQFQCTKCVPAVSFTEGDLFQHTMSAHNTCPTCLQEFESYRDLVEHHEINHILQLQCAGCPLIFTSVSTLRRHYEVTGCLARGGNPERDPAGGSEVERSDDLASERQYRCPRCTFALPAGDFLRHIQGGSCGYDLLQGDPMERFVAEMRRQSESPDSDVTLVEQSTSFENNRHESPSSGPGWNQ